MLYMSGAMGRDGRGAALVPAAMVDADGVGAADPDRVIASLADHKRAGRPGWGQATRGAAAALHRSGHKDRAITLLRGLVAEPETQFDKLEGLRQLALYLTLQAAGEQAARGGDSGPAREAQAAYESLRAQVRSNPAMGTTHAFVMSSALLEEAGLALQVRDRARAEALYQQLAAMPENDAMPTHRATAMGMLSVLREQAGDLSTALHWFDQWVKATTSLDTPEAVLSAELRRLRLVDPERQQPETLRRLRELWNDPRFTSLPDVAAVAQPLIEAQFIQGQPHAGLDTAVETLHRVDFFRQQWGIAPGPVPISPNFDKKTKVAGGLEIAERTALTFMQQGEDVGRFDLAHLACLRWDVYLVDHPDRRANIAAQAEKHRQRMAQQGR
jgi:hypothetical protein